eukprot:TRINITY_DN1390_c0_g6_i1.p1 TRINITY_DN1390_c0_g6~~TRINITY_DN1390_c0_g6_i1.p1  ORF type:complete len:659 (+),score=114.22 TRINITY_DN1390_c0_g6_i1:436-2412(+)
MYSQGAGYPGHQYPPQSTYPQQHPGYESAYVAPVGFGSLGFDQPPAHAYPGAGTATVVPDPNAHIAYYANTAPSHAAAASYYTHVNTQGYGYASYSGPTAAASTLATAKAGVLMGPVLLFRGVGYSDGSYHVAALIATKASHPPTLTVTSPYQAAVSCECLKSVRWKEKDINYGFISKDRRKTQSIKQDQFAYLWCYEWNIRQTETAQVVRYSVSEWPDETFWYEVPAWSQSPKIVFTSCNGFHSDSERARFPGARAGEMWRRINEQHWKSPFHLLIQGGDQIYADAIFKRVKGLKEWEPPNPVNKDGRLSSTRFDEKRRNKVDSCYFKMYCEHWTEPQQRRTFAHVPSIMTWDDHDIFDGWGSYDDTLLHCETWKGIYNCALENFMAFQLGMKKGGMPPRCTLPKQYTGLTAGYVVGGVGVLSLDLRSERTLKQVIHPQSRNAIYEFLNQLQASNNSGYARCRHLLVVSSVPIMYNDLDIAEKALSLLPWQHELLDDLRDHWRSIGHLNERKELLDRLLNFAATANCRVTFLSGDVHLAALGVINRTYMNSNAGCIFQLVSSAVMNAPPPPALTIGLESVGVGKNKEKIDSTTDGKMVKFPGTKKSHIGERNFLTITPSPTTSYLPINVEWFCEKTTEKLKLQIWDVCNRAPEVDIS